MKGNNLMGKKKAEEEDDDEEDSQQDRSRGGLYLSGGRTVTRDSHRLTAYGITAIVNAADNVCYASVEGGCTPAWCWQRVKAADHVMVTAGLPGCRTHHLPLKDMNANACVPTREIRRALEFIEEELARGCVLVHCRGGVNRFGAPPDPPPLHPAG